MLAPVNSNVMRKGASLRLGDFARFFEHTADTENISCSLQLRDEGQNGDATP